MSKDTMEQYNRYREITGKKDSLYMYVLYNCTYQEIKDHIHKQLDTIDKVPDGYKRKLFSSRYFLFKEFLNDYNDDHIFNCTLFIDDNIDSYQLDQSVQKLLRKYDNRHITYRCDDRYDLQFLEDLLTNDDPYHVFRINGNKIDYVQMTKTKKYVVESKESKQLDLTEFITDNLPPNKKCILYGVSSKLKNFNDDRTYDIITKNLKDEEVIELIDRVDQEDILIALDKDLEMLHDDKQMHKVVFKKTIQEKIQYAQLEKLYIRSDMYDKFMSNMNRLELDTNFKIIQIDLKIESFIEDREKKILQYGGVVGITYY